MGETCRDLERLGLRVIRKHSALGIVIFSPQNESHSKRPSPCSQNNRVLDINLHVSNRVRHDPLNPNTHLYCIDLNPSLVLHSG